jgi:hypothetical protein
MLPGCFDEIKHGYRGAVDPGRQAHDVYPATFGTGIT